MSEPRDYATFRDEAERAGMPVEDYHGRAMYHGPAVRTDETGQDGPTLVDVIRATSTPVQWDNMGEDWIVYPR